jgi:hypothetical protein
VIQLRQDELPEVKQAAIKTHLAVDTVHLLIEQIVESKRDSAIVDAITPAMEARDYPAKLDESNAKLRAAHKYNTCLEVLHELRQQKEPFTLAKPV